MKQTNVLLVFTIILFALTANGFSKDHDQQQGHGEGHEEGHGGQKEGFSGMIMGGGMWMNSTSQLEVNDKNKKMKSLNDNADAFDKYDPAIIIDLRYALTSGTEFYIGIPIEEDGHWLRLGASQGFSDGSQLSLSALMKIFETEVWKNPYQGERDREETQKDSYGVKVGYDRIMGSGFKLGFKYTFLDVKDDDIGLLYDDLQRDGAIFIFGGGYEFDLGNGNMISPGVEYILGQMDGKSNSYDGIKGKLSYKKMAQEYMVELSCGIGGNEYDKENPIFMKVGKEFTYEAMGIYIWLNLFGVKDLFADLGAGIEGVNSNIDFYDSRTFFCFAGIGYQFE